MSSGKHKGGFGKAEHGIDSKGRKVTAAYGWGTKQDHTLIADGHVPKRKFRQSDNHDHADGQGGYKDRGRYSGS